MGWKTREIKKIIKEKYFIMEIDELAEAILKKTVETSPVICIIHSYSLEDIKNEMMLKIMYISEYNNPDANPNGALQIYGVRVIGSLNVERDSIEIY